MAGNKIFLVPDGKFSNVKNIMRLLFLATEQQ